MTREDAEQAITARRRELVERIFGDAIHVAEEVDAASRTLVRDHPFLCLGSSVAAGVGLGMVARRAPAALIKTPLKLAQASLRWFPIGRVLRGGA